VKGKGEREKVKVKVAKPFGGKRCHSAEHFYLSPFFLSPIEPNCTVKIG
jgi:hypothetical protein